MITTERKDKIAHTLSYPLGAGEISEFAGEFPQQSQTSIRFVAQHGLRASFWKETLRNGTPYNVLEFGYEVIEQRSFGEFTTVVGWTITVYPILRSLRSHAHDGLLNAALPLLHNWLLETSTREGRRRVSSMMWFQFDPIEKSIIRV